jgi:uncharacterized protein YigA (DUF484 family)
MSQQKVHASIGEVLSEKEIAEYLRRHPDFFERHGRLLLHLRLPHATGSSTISLVERQVAMLRQRNDQLERRLKDLVSVARQNDQVVERIHRLALQLMRSADGAKVLELIETSLREDFSAERAVLVLFADASNGSATRPGFLRVCDREDPALKPFSTFIRAAKTRCGPLRERQRQFLFGPENDAIGSAAMVPLGTGVPKGFLTIGSRDEQHFNPGKSMDFLNRLGEIVAVSLGLENHVDD